MKAIVFNTPGNASVLHAEERAIPSVRENEVLIKVVAAGINRTDIIQRHGKYPAPDGVAQDILGLEVSGIIEKTGTNVSQWKEGQEVCALLPGGGYAEYAVADAGSCLPIPEQIGLRDSAALPEVLFTVWHNVFQRGSLKREENVLIYGGSGGIGCMAIQLVTLFGAHAFAVAGSEEKVKFCIESGASKVINYKTESLLNKLGPGSVDLILDSVGGEYFNINLELLRSEGRLIYINAMGGAKPELDILKMMRKRIHITGSTLRTRSNEFKKDLAEDIRRHAFPLLEDNRFVNMVKYRFPMEKAAEAHALMDSREFTGKIILCF